VADIRNTSLFTNLSVVDEKDEATRGGHSGHDGCGRGHSCGGHGQGDGEKDDDMKATSCLVY